MLRPHSLLEELESSIGDVVPEVLVTLVGEWSTSRRRSYQQQSKTDSGTGRIVDIEDHQWNGTFECSLSVVCIAFLLTRDSLSWAKSSPAAPLLPITLSISAYAGFPFDRASFAATVGGARLPSVAVNFSGKPSHDVAVDISKYSTGRLARVARLEEAEVFVYFVPGSLVKVGRKRLWHLRPDIAATLPDPVRELLTAGRNHSTR